MTAIKEARAASAAEAREYSAQLLEVKARRLRAQIAAANARTNEYTDWTAHSEWRQGVEADAKNLEALAEMVRTVHPYPVKTAYPFTIRLLDTEPDREADGKDVWLLELENRKQVGMIVRQRDPERRRLIVGAEFTVRIAHDDIPVPRPDRVGGSGPWADKLEHAIEFAATMLGYK